MRRMVLVTCVTLLGLLGCGGDDGEASGSTTTRRAPPSTAEADAPEDDTAFCDAMTELSTTTPSPARLEEIYATLETDAPDEIRGDLAVFIANSRAVSDAFAAAGAPTAQVDVEEVLATLTPEQRQFVEDLAESTRTGTPPDNETGRVTVYFLTSCP